MCSFSFQIPEKVVLRTTFQVTAFFLTLFCSLESKGQEITATWLGGTKTLTTEATVHGTLGVPAASNNMKARANAGTWRLANGDIYIFGGWGYDSEAEKTIMSDLWKWDGTDWTWINGPTVGREIGVYGERGVAAETNRPGARDNLMTWVDDNGDLYMFGGFGRGADGYSGYLNSLWKYDGENWTWVSGSPSHEPVPNRGTLGVPAAENVPSGRLGGVTWQDENGDVYLYGGFGYSDDRSAYGSLNDFWKWDGENWTWLSGTGEVNQLGVFGEIGVADPENYPPGLQLGVSWVSNEGHFYMFGGKGFDQSGLGLFNTIWRWDGENWTWVHGPNQSSEGGNHGTKGVANASNIPGARTLFHSWKMDDGSVYVFGGSGYDGVGGADHLSDLWKWDGENWTWVFGSEEGGALPTYGSVGETSHINIPGGRRYGLHWIGKDNNLYLYGGVGYDEVSGFGRLSDFWRINIQEATEPLKQSIDFAVLEDKIYGDDSFEVIATASSGLTVDLTSSNPEVAEVNGNTVTILGAGTATIVAAQAGNDIFQPAQSVSQNFTIAKASLTVSIEDATINKGGEIPEFELNYQGFVNDDIESSLTMPPTVSTTATISSARGTYPIELSGGSDDNYEFTLIDAILTITGPEVTLPTLIEFGQVAVGMNQPQTLEFDNTGDGELSVSGITLAEGFMADKSSFSVSPGTQESVTITFKPTQAKAYSGDIKLSTNDGELSIALTGQGELVTSIEETTALGKLIKVYPNPASTFIIVDLSAVNGALGALKLTNLQSNSVPVKTEVQGHYVNLDVSEVAKGMYIIVIPTIEGTTFKKVKLID